MTYDVETPAGKWVIRTVDRQEVDRNYEGWALMPAMAPPVELGKRGGK